MIPDNTIDSFSFVLEINIVLEFHICTPVILDSAEKSRMAMKEEMPIVLISLVI